MSIAELHRKASGRRVQASDSRFGIWGVFAVLTLLGVDALVISRVPWDGVLVWPTQVWHFSFATLMLVILLISAPAARIVAAVGALGGLCFYGDIWGLLAERGLAAEIAWYVLYIGLHAGGLLAGIYSCQSGNAGVGAVSLAIVAVSIALNIAFLAVHAPDGAYCCPLPPVDLH